MSARQMIELWRRACECKEPFYLATVVHVEGSSYRKPGARMLVTASGQRCGTISGGCLEADVVRRIGWLTSEQSVIESYHSDFEEDTELPSGTGCGGTVWILLQSTAEADKALRAIEQSVQADQSFTFVVTMTGLQAGQVEILPSSQLEQEQASSKADTFPNVVNLPLSPPPKLFLFGAGDDVQPLARFADELGWTITIADGRRQLVRSDRFPSSATLQHIEFCSDANGRSTISSPLQGVDENSFVVLLTHSLAQDQALLRELLPRRLRYLGVLGPRHRTERIIQSLLSELPLSAEACLRRVQSPAGLPLGSNDPPSIALSIVAQIQLAIHRGDCVTPTACQE